MVWRIYDRTFERDLAGAVKSDAEVDKAECVGQESNQVKEHGQFYFDLRIATPHGRVPTFILETTCSVDASITDTSFDGPFAV